MGTGILPSRLGAWSCSVTSGYCRCQKCM